MNALGTLKRLDPRQVWAHEATEFTPWLADQLDMLGDAIGLELELVRRESSVGDFSVDLLARDLGSNQIVVIENQLEVTDHSHLGQLLTYAAGTSAGSVIWICREFREEHRQALDWLNEHCLDIDFFGVVLEVLQINDSAPAPNFRPIAFPNDWTRRSHRVAGSGELSERTLMYQEFFQRLLDQLREEHRFTGARKGQPQSWYSFSSGHTGFKYGFSFARGNEIRAEIYIDTGEADENLMLFDGFFADSDAIAQEFGEPLRWERLDNSRACRIATYHTGSIDDSDEQLEAHLAWAIDRLLRIKHVFGNRLAALAY